MIARIFAAFAAALVAAAAFGAERDWTRFGWDAQRSSAPAVDMGIGADNVARLERRQVRIDGTVDASLIYLSEVEIGGSKHDAFFGTTTYGKTFALDADRGTVLWEFTPPGYRAFSGSPRITTATPVADPDRRFIYAAAPDGFIRKLAVADGREAWRTSVTRLPRREKIASPLNFFRGRVIAVTGGYIGDAPPYQGHVAVLDAGSGKLLAVWNSLCSDRHELLDPQKCGESGSAIWGRAGAVVDPASGNLYIATGNGKWDGKLNWGDSVIELDPEATRMLGNYTPEDTQRLEEEDADLGSSSPVLLGEDVVAQGGKDRLIHLLDWRRMRGAAPHRGGALSSVPTPSGSPLFTAPAVSHIDGASWLFAADSRGTAAWILNNKPGFHERWHIGTGGTSPVLVDGLLFVYDPRGGLNVYEAKSGRRVATLECGRGHWNSPIVADGRIALPEGNANDHATSGVIDIWAMRSGQARRR